MTTCWKCGATDGGCLVVKGDVSHFSIALCPVCLTERLSREFRDQVRRDVSELGATFPKRTMVAIDMANAQRQTGLSCASHDYCDANVSMDVAFRRATGMEWDIGNSGHNRLVNDAWDHAKRAGFAL